MRGRHFPQRLQASVLALLLLGSYACGHTDAVQPAPVSPTVPSVKQPGPAAKHSAASKGLPLTAPEPPHSIGDVMGDHFMITSWARDSVIAGMLDPLHSPLSALADYRYDDVRTGGWLPWIAQLQAAARLTSNAATLEVAAMGVATMARVCGECHRANHAGPAIPPPPDPLERFPVDTVGDRMGRHMWASELLWEGITGPSEASWKAGAKTLIEAPDVLDGQMPESFDAALLTVKGLGHDAQAAETLADRANVYGLLIATCADCHSRWIEHGSFEPSLDDGDDGSEWNDDRSQRPSAVGRGEQAMWRSLTQER